MRRLQEKNICWLCGYWRTKMKEWTKFAEACHIFAKYPNSYPQAEHDIIYGGLVEGISLEDCARLKEIGWHIDEEYDCFATFV